MPFYGFLFIKPETFTCAFQVGGLVDCTFEDKKHEVIFVKHGGTISFVMLALEIAVASQVHVHCNTFKL